MSAKPRDYLRLANQYAARILKGAQPAAPEVVLACRRWEADKVAKRWRFDRAAAERVCRFIELLPHIKGKWVRDNLTIKLGGWQCFITVNLFGWVHKKTGLRRFRTAYLELGRKNGKTTYAAAIGLYLLTADGEPGAEVYCAAKTNDQAREVFDVARQMLIKSGADKRLACKVEMKFIWGPDKLSKFKPVASESDALDGSNPHGIITDELHAHKTPDVYNALDQGTGARDQSLHLSITTAGNNRAGICWSIRTKTIGVLEGRIRDDSHFGIIYRALEQDDTSLLSTWRKANPNLGQSITLDNFKTARRKALDTPSLYSAWLTKRLNIWTGSADPWLKPGKWEAATRKISPHDYIGKEGWRAVVGVDLSSIIDLSAIGLLFWRGNEVGVPVGDGKEFRPTVNEYRVFCQSYVPEERARERGDDGYLGFIERGECIATPGDVIDRRRIDRDIVRLSDITGAIQIGFDPWDSTHSIQGLQASGYNCVVIRHTVANLSPAMKELEAALLDGRLQHDGDSCLGWQIGAVTARVDERGNIYPRKEDRRNPRIRIDAAVAVILCFAQVLAGFAEPEGWQGGVLPHELYGDNREMA